ncbi:uncharacterized protein LOC127777894 isoform X2 [Oryza glaberrima]|uniref:uncharacterized protein LOC127777894 isoform X2 n=1 Tax=Oryza glaberrima TaxID=4538 RepID=UPI00224BF566|nr:uncharacterized protein LOC127777894 isoform X2 [Oryza glaberrima]
MVGRLGGREQAAASDGGWGARRQHGGQAWVAADRGWERAVPDGSGRRATAERRGSGAGGPPSRGSGGGSIPDDVDMWLATRASSCSDPAAAGLVLPKSAAGDGVAAGEGDVDVEELEMMKMMGIPVGFDSTKGKHVPDADVSGVRVVTKRQPRQYMNRRGGFNRSATAEDRKVNIWLNGVHMVEHGLAMHYSMGDRVVSFVSEDRGRKDQSSEDCFEEARRCSFGRSALRGG